MRTRYRMINGVLTEVARGENRRTMEIIRDSYLHNPVISPVDGTLIDSREALRKHNERNGVMNYEPVTRKSEDTYKETLEETREIYQKYQQGYYENYGGHYYDALEEQQAFKERIDFWYGEDE